MNTGATLNCMSAFQTEQLPVLYTSRQKKAQAILLHSKQRHQWEPVRTQADAHIFFRSLPTLQMQEAKATHCSRCVFLARQYLRSSRWQNLQTALRSLLSATMRTLLSIKRSLQSSDQKRYGSIRTLLSPCTRFRQIGR